MVDGRRDRCAVYDHGRHGVLEAQRLTPDGCFATAQLPHLGTGPLRATTPLRTSSSFRLGIRAPLCKPKIAGSTINVRRVEDTIPPIIGTGAPVNLPDPRSWCILRLMRCRHRQHVRRRPRDVH